MNTGHLNSDSWLSYMDTEVCAMTTTKYKTNNSSSLYIPFSEKGQSLPWL